MSKLLPEIIYGVVDNGNSTTAPLGIGGIFSGTSKNTLNYGIAYINTYSDVASATDGLVIQQSVDSAIWRHTDKFTIQAGAAKNFSINLYAKYFRIVYTNGGIAQTTFELQVLLKATGKPSSHRIQDSIISDDDAELVKAVLTGEDPDGNFINFAATRQGNFKVSIDEYGDTPSIDAFDRLRVSEPFTIFDSKQLHDKQPLFWDETIGGSATSTHDVTNAAVEMAVTASATDYVIRQTKQSFNYQPGKGQLILFTFIADRATGVTIKAGFFNGTGVNYLTPNNGIFLEIDDTTSAGISWNIAKNGTTTETATQTSWNVDPMDGTGPSGLTLNLDATVIGIIDFEWLGVGRIRCGFVIDGLIRYVHYFNHANDPTFTSVYMSTPNLPIRYMIESDGTSAGQLDHICSTVMSEGGVEETGVLRSVDTGNVHVDANSADTTYAIVGVRLKSTYLDVTVYPEFMSMISETNDDFKWSLLINPTIAGTFTYNDVANSSIQYAAGATANTVSAYDVQVDSGYAQSNASVDRQFKTQLRIGAQIDGTRDTLVLCATPLSTQADIQATLTIRELL